VLVYARAGELRVERVELGRLAAEVAEDLGPSVEAAGATLEIRELPEVDGDPRQLRRVLQNLVGNALKFRSSEAPPRVELSALRDSHEWVVTARDNGVGVDPDQASRIFEMLSRASRAPSPPRPRDSCGGNPRHSRGDANRARSAPPSLDPSAVRSSPPIRRCGVEEVQDRSVFEDLYFDWAVLDE
jgi:hypothetical protein